MGAWRGVGLLCSLMVGCGGPLPEETIQEGERPEAISPTEAGDEDVADRRGRAEPGTARLVKDIFPPSDRPPRLSDGPGNLVAFRGKLYFATHFEDGRGALWKSDGTEAGTGPVKEFPGLPGSDLPAPVSGLTPLGTQLFFVAGDEAHGGELWVSDGTAGGTRLVKDIEPGPEDSSPFNLTAVDNTLLFFRFTPGTPEAPGHTELWRSDGTEAGTVRVRDMGADSALTYSQVLIGGTLFFVFTDPAHGTELWKTDGTEAGTVLVKDILPGPGSTYPFNLRAVGGDVFFTATTPNSGSQLWRTNGSEAGTVLVRELASNPDVSAQLLGVTGRSLYFSLTDTTTHLMRLYTLTVDDSGGISEQLVATLPNPFAEQPDADPRVTHFTVAGGKLFFALAISSSGPAPRDVQLWVSDGTGAGTQQLYRPLSLSDEFETQLYTLDDRILFSAIDERTGLDLWVSDGTVSGTRLLQDLAPGAASSYPSGFTRVGCSVFFTAHDPTHGRELRVLPLQH